MENKYRCDVCRDSGAVKTGEFEYSECPCISDDRNFNLIKNNYEIYGEQKSDSKTNTTDNVKRTRR